MLVSVMAIAPVAKMRNCSEVLLFGKRHLSFLIAPEQLSACRGATTAFVPGCDAFGSACSLKLRVGRPNSFSSVEIGT